MAAVTRNTTEVTNFEATPQKMNNPQHVDAKLHIAELTFELATADNSGAIYGLLWVNRYWSIKDIRVKCDAVNSGSDFDLGLYSSPGDTPDSADLSAADTDGDHDVYGAAIDLSSAIAVWTSIDNKSPELVADQVWEDAGESDDADAKEWYLLALTANFDPAAADTVSVQVLYTRPGGA